MVDSAEPIDSSRTGGLALWLRRRGVLVSGAVWLLLVLNFGALRFTEDDEYVQFSFVQRLFGDTKEASGYFFGLGLVEAPFYAVADLFHAAGVDSVRGRPIHELAIALGFALLSVLVWPLLAPVLRGLELPRPGLALLAAALGTPFFYYDTMQPAKTHAIEALLFTAVVALAYRYFSAAEPERWLPLALGVAIGFSVTVRYYLGAEAIALVACLWLFRHRRAAVEVAAASVLVPLVLVTIPLAFGETLLVTEFEQGGLVGHNEHATSLTVLDPVFMLFGNQRGLFVWSPIAALAVAGFVWLLRNRPQQRRFLVTASAMAAAILAPYALTPWGTTGWSFSNRFLTVLLPVVAIGLAGLFAALPRLALALAAGCVAWALFLMFTLVFDGAPLITIPNATTAAQVGRTNHWSWRFYPVSLAHHSNFLRWALR